LFEMKKRGENLAAHYDQAFDYWVHLVPNRPRYVILCNFDEFWIYEFDYQLYDPRDKLRVEDLPRRPAPLNFLRPKAPEPVFATDTEAVTREAADSLSQLYESIRRRYPPEVAQRFVLQCMVAMFAEDIDLLPEHLFTKTVRKCKENADSTYDMLFLMFHAMNRAGGSHAGRFRTAPYVNGGIFAQIDPVHLTETELDRLIDVAGQDWSQVRPAIFGTIFEKSMDQVERHRVGAQFTAETDIQRVIQPVITRPWRARIEAAATLDDLRQSQRDLATYRVLDPACGSGNFLYIAYRELKKLEKEAADLAVQRFGAPAFLPEIPRVSVNQFYGIDIKPFAVELAKVTLMIAKKLAIDELALDEPALPFPNLDENIQVNDALFTDWPAFDACIGNPPYLGAKRLKQEYDIGYVNRIRAAFPDVPGNADYCVYWFRKAHERMYTGTRAGLVGTNTIRQNYSRKGGLDYIVANQGYIYEAIGSMDWTGEANVTVSIVCWSKGEPPFRPARLDEDGSGNPIALERISSSLSKEVDVAHAHLLSINVQGKRTGQGQIPGHEGFILTGEIAEPILKRDPKYRDVVFPYLIGDDLVAQNGAQPSRYIMDMNGRDYLEASAYKLVFDILEKRVLPDRQSAAKTEQELDRWWGYTRARPELMTALRQMKRYIACSRVTRRPIFEFISPAIRPDTALQVFLFEDDYNFGILQSRLHWVWFVAKGSTLRGDYRYTPESVFYTFPFPQLPDPKRVLQVALAARELHEFRRDLMVRDEEMTLRRMYSSLEKSGKNKLKELTTALNRAVYAAYDFDPKGDPLAQLLALNEDVYQRIQRGEPVTAPGIPADYPDPAELVSAGCIQPRTLL
jgi:SAM-dependent methyltransferase